LDRLKYETEVIIDKNMVNYFMILDDILSNFVYKTGGNTGAGRGSAPGSIVLFILDITKIDPVKHNLIFERFLNPARKDPADVDLDIDSDTQKQVEDYLKGKYGDDKVCHISNFGKFGAKTVVKDLCRIFKLDYVLSNKLTSYFDTIRSDLPVDEQLKKARTIANSQRDDKLVKFIDDNAKLLTDIGNKFVGMIRQPGRHASGILISNKKLNQSDIPILRVKGDLVTGVQEGGDEREIGELGYCKLDLLGLNTALINSKTIKAVEEKYGIEDIERGILRSELDDPKIYDEFCKGNSRDIFQFGSDGMVSLVKKVQPRNIVDLTAINALWRPAVIEAGGVKDFLVNKANADKAKRRLDKIHPALWEILGETYGVPAFQEQIMFILQSIGGFSLDEADNGRKILKLLHKGNQEKTDDFYNMLEKFENGAKEQGVKEKDLAWLLDIMGKYSEYSFNKSHSFSYSLNAYISMYLKVYYPKEYYVQLLNHSATDDLSWFIKEAKASNMKFLDFKHGFTTNEFGVNYEEDAISLGLNIVKGLSNADIEKINSLKADNIYQLVEEIHKTKISKRSFEPLCRLKYFHQFENLQLLETVLNETKRLKKKEILKEKIDNIIAENNDIDNYTNQEVLVFEKKYLNFYISKHPFVKFSEYIYHNDRKMYENIYSPKEIPPDMEDGTYLVYGIINNIEIKKSKKTGREYYKVILEDEENQMYVTLFNSYDIVSLNEGNSVVIITSKNDFGFAKLSKSKIFNFTDKLV
jgi:DNA polymerase-3 subunit alpha